MLSGFNKWGRTTLRNYALLLWGSLLTILGGVGTITFLCEMPDQESISLSQLATRLLLPHVALLTGLGFILASIILLRKQRVMQDRQQPPPS